MKNEDIFKLQIGRFFVVPYRLIFRGNITLPWLVGLIGFMWTSIAVCLVICLLNITSPIIIILISGMMVTNITYISQIATYMHEFDVNALALLLSVLAVWLWNKGLKVGNIIWGTVCLIVSLGIYQAYITVTMVLVLWILITRLLENGKVKDTLKKGLDAFVMLLASGLVYFVVGKVIYAITDTDAMSRTTVYLFKNGKFLLPYYLKLIIPGLKLLAQAIVHAAYPRPVLCVLLAMVLIILGASLGYTLIKKPLGWKHLGVIGGLTVLLPFVMCAIFFLARGRDVHDLMWYSAWFFYIFILLLAFWTRKQEVVSKKVGNWVCIISCVSFIFVLAQNVILANTAYMKKTIEANSTLSTMTRVVAQMEGQEEYVVGETPVAFVGVGEVYETLPGFQKVGCIKGLATNMSVSQDTSLYYYNAYKAYFDFVLNYPIVFVDDEMHAQLKENKEVQALPSFPQKDCMKMIDGVLVVKMGNDN